MSILTCMHVDAARCNSEHGHVLFLFLFIEAPNSDGLQAITVGSLDKKALSKDVAMVSMHAMMVVAKEAKVTRTDGGVLQPLGTAFQTKPLKTLPAEVACRSTP